MLQLLKIIEILKWIENVWKMLEDCVNKGSRPKHKVDLVARIYLAWKEFSTKTSEVFIASMLQHMMAVINAKGGSTRW
jgi:hypothetical protein